MHGGSHIECAEEGGSAAEHGEQLLGKRRSGADKLRLAARCAARRLLGLG